MESHILTESGKSSFLKVLEDFDYIVVPEPISKWQQVKSDSSNTEDMHHGVGLFPSSFMYLTHVG